MGRADPSSTRIPYATTVGTGLVVALGSLVGPDRPRPFKVPFVRFEAILGAIARVFMMAGLGLLLYFG